MQHFSGKNKAVPKATDDQIKKAAALIKRVDLKDFSVCQLANPGKLFLPPCLPKYLESKRKRIMLHMLLLVFLSDALLSVSKLN